MHLDIFTTPTAYHRVPLALSDFDLTLWEEKVLI